jgi:SAM-dependent methyltransferase
MPTRKPIRKPPPKAKPPGKESLSRPKESFDKAYYQRFYLNPATRVRATSAETSLARFVFGYLEHLGIPVKRVLDMGCGLGKWRGQTAKFQPHSTYTGVEISAYLCGKYGWVESSAAEFQGRGGYDLVLCQSVIQYLGEAEAKAAIANLARLCRGALYLEIITAEDWARHCDRKLTDGKVHLRSSRWYKKALGLHFRSAGGGIFLPKDSPVVLYELERG